MQTMLDQLADSARMQINSDRYARDCLTKLSQAGCDAAWITQALALLPIADDFVRAWRKISGRGSRKLKKSLDLIGKASHEIFRIGQGLPIEIAVLLYRHPSVPMLDHAQNLGAENLPWLLGEYSSLLSFLDRLAGQGRPAARIESPGERMLQVKWKWRGPPIETIEIAEKPASDGNTRFKITMRDGRVRHVKDKPSKPPVRPYDWPEFPDLVQWAIVEHVQQKTGKYFDAEISYLIAVVMKKPDYSYDETAHRVWRLRNKKRLQKTFKSIGLLPGTQAVFGDILKM